jgi:hypothetical protein
MSDEETPAHEINPVFEKLQKSFTALKIIDEEKKKRNELNEMSNRFDTQMKNFERNLYNTKLYNNTFPIKEFLLDSTYEVNEGLEEYVYLEYFKRKYTYSDVTSNKIENIPSKRLIKIILLDHDRDVFLAKYNISVEERMIPEYYFVHHSK